MSEKSIENSVYNEEYIPFIIKWGRGLNLLGAVLAFGPILVLAIVFGLVPPATAIISASISALSIFAIFWVVEPISYFPILGIPGTYMAFLSGNISNLRLPCAAVAQASAGVEPGTEAGSIIAAVGIAVSILVNTTILTVGVVLGAAVLNSLPPGVTQALQFLVPALFGGIFAMFAFKTPIIGVIALAFALPMSFLMRNGYLGFLPGYPSYAVIIVSVFGTILVSKAILGKKVAEK